MLRSARLFTLPTYESIEAETMRPYRAPDGTVGVRHAWMRQEEVRMKLVTAIIKPHLVEGVTEALDSMDVSGMTLTEVRGHGRQRGHSEVYRGGEYRVDFLPKVRIEVLVKDGDTDKVANTIIEKARTGKIGDGKLWIQPVEMTVRIRTGELGDEAL